mmetsp:Transcript_8037/g.18780  ORF Transcript_8037/g.18780 Transcript_8037/m.18780 type:complete len:459 (-) Transcript_8037:46-1422(-)
MGMEAGTGDLHDDQRADAIKKALSESVQRCTDSVTVAEVEVSQVLETVKAMLDGEVTRSHLDTVQEFLQARLDAVRTVHQELAAEQIKARSSEGAKFQPQLRALVTRVRALQATLMQQKKEADEVFYTKQRDAEESHKAALALAERRLREEEARKLQKQAESEAPKEAAPVIAVTTEAVAPEEAQKDTEEATADAQPSAAEKAEAAPAKETTAELVQHASELTQEAESLAQTCEQAIPKLEEGGLSQQDAIAAIKKSADLEAQANAKGAEASDFIKSKTVPEEDETSRDELERLLARVDLLFQRMVLARTELQKQKVQMLLTDMGDAVKSAELKVKKAVEAARKLQPELLHLESVEHIKEVTEQTSELEKDAALTCAEARKRIGMKLRSDAASEAPLYKTELLKMQRRLEVAFKELQPVRPAHLNSKKLWAGKQDAAKRAAETSAAPASPEKRSRVES